MIIQAEIAVYEELVMPPTPKTRTMTRPRALDLFSGAGGAAMGLYRAGFDVVGVDWKPQPRYPCFHDAEYAGHFQFVQADAMAFPLEGFDFIWASPPCQAYSNLAKRWRNADKHPDLIELVRDRLQQIGMSFVIENVYDAPLLSSVLLCGSMFGLESGPPRRLWLKRHRYFECHGFNMLSPPCRHPRGRKACWVFGNGGGRVVRRNPKRPGDIQVEAFAAERREAMQIDWMRNAELSQAVPPAYAEFIGRAALQVIQG